MKALRASLHCILPAYFKTDVFLFSRRNIQNGNVRDIAAFSYCISIQSVTAEFELKSFKIRRLYTYYFKRNFSTGDQPTITLKYKLIFKKKLCRYKIVCSSFSIHVRF